MKEWEVILTFTMLAVVLIAFGVKSTDAQVTNSIILPTINAEVPITEPAVTLASYWPTSIIINAPSPSKKVSLNYSLVPYDGIATIATDSAYTVRVYIPDLMSLAATDPNVAKAMNDFIIALEDSCKAQGKCQ